MKVLFLDYDGVVNTPMWDNDGIKCRYNHSGDGYVNNFQALQWISELCEKYNYKIVVSSTWRFWDNYIDCLFAGGLREDVEVIGCTPVLRHPNVTRGEEIQAWLNEHKDVEKFLIVDDETDMGSLIYALVLCDPEAGFTRREFRYALQLDKDWEKIANKRREKE